MSCLEERRYRYYRAAPRKLSVGALSLPPGLLSHLPPEPPPPPPEPPERPQPQSPPQPENACRKDVAVGEDDQPRRPFTRMTGGFRRPTSLPPEPPPAVAVAARKRSSCHQDVEEALSSLLWQPYEYRSGSTDTLSSVGSASSASDVAGTTPGRRMLQSFTDEFAPVVLDGNIVGAAGDLALVGDQCAGARWSRGPGPRCSVAPPCGQVAPPGSHAESRVVCEQAVQAVRDVPVRDPSVCAAMRVEVPGAEPPWVGPANPQGSANVVGLPNQRISVDVNTEARVSSFYRAVPVNVVSTVPTIQCLNSTPETGNDVSNVHIVQAMPSTDVPRTRTFTSTEAQTDDTAVGALAREARRRERRERRHQRRVTSHHHQAPLVPQVVGSTPLNYGGPCGPPTPGAAEGRLPDLLNSHLPPPYSAPHSPAGPLVPAPMVPYQVPLVQAAPVAGAPHAGFRFPFPSAAGFRRCRSRLGPRYSEEQPKSCCGFLVSRPGSLRWFIALIAMVAVCCVLVGTVLGAMRPAGRDHLTVSLLMIGVGIILVTVSGVAWRLTSHDAPSCRAMLGLEGAAEATAAGGDVCARRFVPRLPPSYGRPHHPYAAMIYPEFQYRPPPPSYQASMQEYRLRLLLLDRGAAPQPPGAQHVASPPPTYRSHAGSLLRAPLTSRRDATQSEYSCPPSYRSRSSSNRPNGTDTIQHSREHSLSLSESNPDGSVVNVVNILTNPEDDIALDNMTLDSLKVVPENEIPPLRMLLKGSSSDLESSKDGNLVTIVQKADQSPVIVTVSGSHMSTTNAEVGSSNRGPSEMEILAHL